MTSRIAIVTICLSMTMSAGAGSPDDSAPRVVRLHWTTADAIDRLDLAHMGRSIRQFYPKDEDCAIAVWKFVRQTMYHYPMRTENHDDRMDAAKLINAYGYSFCTQQGVTAAAVGQAAEIKARVIGVPGHGMYELFYDGRWHAFCTTSGFYVRTRHPDRHIASMEELAADSTLVTDARGEQRASHPYLPCAGGPEILGEPEGTQEVPYALSYRYYDEDFFIKVAKDWRDLGAPNPSRYDAWLSLRDGESIRLQWDASDHFVPPRIGSQFHPPRHLCGMRDRANPFFEQIAPYGREVNGQTVYRYIGTGQHAWTPPLQRPDTLGDLARAENIDLHDGAIRRRDAAVPVAFAEFEMNGPYPYVTGTLSGQTHSPNAEDEVTLFVQGTDTEAPWIEVHSAPRGADTFQIPLTNRLLPTVPVNPRMRRSFTPYRFRVRVKLTGEATLSDLEISANVQHNWAVLPRLSTGKNVVKVVSKDDSVPGDVVFELAWSEGDQRRHLRHKLLSADEHFTVDIPSSEPVRMRHAMVSRAK